MPMSRIRGNERKTNQERINAPLLLACLAHISRHGGVALPELVDVAKDSGWPTSRATLNRMLTDAEYHLGVRVRWRQDHTLPSNGEYWIEDWGVLDSRRVLSRVSSRQIHEAAPKAR